MPQARCLCPLPKLFASVRDRPAPVLHYIQATVICVTNTQNQNDKSSTLWVSLVTPHFFLIRITLESILNGWIEIGKASEEVFRGDRLPILNFPEKELEKSNDI